MGTVLASAILSKAAAILLDVSEVRWTSDEKLAHLNDGQRLICKYKTDANVVIDAYQLVEGTKQRIPDGTTAYKNPDGDTLQEGLNLFDVIRNMGTDGVTPGNAIELIDLQLINNYNIGWHTDTASSIVQSYCFDERYPDNYYVYPPQPGGSDWDDSIYDPDASTAEGESVYGWVEYASNTVENIDNEYVITHEESEMPSAANGAGTILTSGVFGDLSENMVIGETYKLEAKVKLVDGDPPAPSGVGIEIADENGDSLVQSDSITPGEDYAVYSVTFTATDVSSMEFRLYDMGDTDVIYIDDIALYPESSDGGGGYVEVAYNALAADIVAKTNVINISDRFQVPLENYVIHRCYAKDAALSPYNATRAAEYWNLFVTELGRLDLLKKEKSPNLPSPTPSPSLQT